MVKLSDRFDSTRNGVTLTSVVPTMESGEKGGYFGGGWRNGNSTEETSSGGSGSDGVSIDISGDGGRETIAVVGSGDFGRALAGRMVKAGGYNVIVGSRDPNKNK